MRDYGRVALITGSYKSAQAGERSDLFALDVWVKDASTWKALIHHNNVLARPDAPSAHVVGGAEADGRAAAALREPAGGGSVQAEIAGRARHHQSIPGAGARGHPQRSRTSGSKHVADEFVVTRTRQHPTDKAARMAFMETQRAINAETFVAEVVTLKFWVLGDAAIMRADHAMPGNRRPPYRATRLWVKRDGHWQMAISQQTTIQP